MTDRNLQIEVRYIADPRFTTSYGNDVILLIRHRADGEPADAYVLTPADASDVAEAITKTVQDFHALRQMAADIDTIDTTGDDE
ncbi:MAG: hypothetical protein ACXVYI_12105 [Mycobacterium sp.]